MQNIVVLSGQLIDDPHFFTNLCSLLLCECFHTEKYCDLFISKHAQQSVWCPAFEEKKCMVPRNTYIYFKGRTQCRRLLALRGLGRVVISTKTFPHKCGLESGRLGPSGYRWQALPLQQTRLSNIYIYILYNIIFLFFFTIFFVLQ